VICAERAAHDDVLKRLARALGVAVTELLE
jgi:energy-converting hydrogenase A subunit M